MTSFIVLAREKNKRLAYTKEYCSKLQIDPFDITIIEKETSSKNLNSIGIDDVKNMQKKIFLKPIKSPIKAIIIEEGHLLTTEAQNALLKVLEEPPNQTIIMISAESKEELLPTIISRCQVIELEEAKRELTVKELQEYTLFIKDLPTLSIGERLKKAELLAKDKDKTMEWIEKLILFVRENMIKSYTINTPPTLNPLVPPKLLTKGDQVSILKSFQSLHTILKTTNVNPRFAIENTFLKLI